MEQEPPSAVQSPRAHESTTHLHASLVYAAPVLFLLLTLYVAIRIFVAIPPPGGAAREVLPFGAAPLHLTFHASIGTAVFLLAFGAIVGGAPILLLRAHRSARVQRDHARADAALQAKERKELEARLIQAQKMESVGRLAGGIAHDFNNLLTVIMGQAQLALVELPASHPVRTDLLDIYQAGKRAAGLTRQLLAFSRQQVFAQTVFSLNDLVTDTDKMLRRMIGEDLHLVTHPALDLARVRADRGQIEQVLMNLVVNARDAMPEGGQLTIETANTVLDDHYAATHPTVSAGDYVVLAVSDTGTGMSDEVQARIFEPFFTTKPAGQGTGLGLATVFGIVKQSGGHVTVYSEVGKGTTFRVYLPRVAAPATIETVEMALAAARGVETILVAEDDAAVRSFTRRALESQGYVVLTAEDAAAALQVAQGYPDPLHLLISDVVLPDLPGPDLARQIAAVRTAIRVLFVSGYTGEAMAQRKVLQSGVPFLQKPFSIRALAEKVRNILDGKA